MSTTIDQKVVEMKFDNSQFESNVKQSMTTLDKLKESLKFDNADKSLQNLNSAANNLDFSGLLNSVQSISDRFSTMGIVGMTIVQNLTNAALNGIKNISTKVFELAKSGGISRALNIESAKFQLDGLGVAWDDIKEDINYAVDGTAYGLDSAAKAASQLVASSVELGDDMKSALRGISGVAAMTNSEYDDIARVFTTVAGNGRLMGDQLNQLAARGLNVAATLGQAMGKTESEIREMVSDGQISFKTFAKAMDDAFGQHAKDANKTFTGVISNIKAALSRIGADFVTPIVENESPIVLMLQRLRERINDVKTALQPLVQVWVSAINTIGSVGQDLFANVDLTEPIVLFYTSLNVLKNALASLLSFIIPIQNAFRNIFPKQGLDNIINAALNLKDFLATMRLSSEHAKQLQTGFEGIFSIFSAIIDVIKGVVKWLFSLVSSTNNVSDSIFNLIEHFGLLLIRFSDLIRSSTLFTTTFDTIRNAVVDFIDKIRSAMEALGGLSTEGLSGFIDELRNATSPLEMVGSVISTVFHGIYNVISGIVPKLIAIFSKCTSIFKDFTNSIVNAFGNSDTGEASNLINGGLLAFVLVKLKSLIGALTSNIKTLKSLLDGGIQDTMSQLKDSLFAWQRDLQADALLKLAGSIAILVGSILLLTGIDTNELAAATSAIGALFAELVIATNSLNILNFKGFSSVLGFTTQMTALVKMAASILILALAVKSIANIPLGDLVKGVAAIGSLMLIMSQFSSYMSKHVAKMTKGISSLVAVSISIRILASSVKALGSLSFEDLVKGVGSLGVIMAELAAFVNITNGMNITKVSTGIIGLSAGLVIMTLAVKNLSSIDLGSLVKGLIGLGGILLELSLFINSVSQSKLSLSALGMIGLAAGIVILSSAVKTLGSLSIGELIKGVVALGAVLVEVLVFINSISVSRVLAAGLGLIVFSGAISLLSNSVEKLGTLDLGTLAKGLISLGVALFAMQKVAKSLVGSLEGVAGMIAMSAALLVLAGALKVIGSMSIDEIAIALGVIAAAIYGFSFVASALTPVLPMLGTLAGSIALLGVACLAAGAGVALFAYSFTALAAIGTAGIASLTGVISGLIYLIPVVVDGITQLFSSLLDSFIELQPKCGEAFTTLINTIFNVITDAFPKFSDLAYSIVLTLFNGIESNIGKIVESANNIVINFLNGITNSLPGIIAAGYDLFISFINGMAQGLRDNVGLMIDAIDNLMASMLFAIGAWLGDFVTNGADILQNFIDGFNSKTGDSEESVGQMLADMVFKIYDFKTDFYNAAVDLILSFLEGLWTNITNVFNAGADVGAAAADGVKSGQATQNAKQSGKDVGSAYTDGLKSGASAVKTSSKNLNTAASDGIKENSKITIDIFNEQGERVGGSYGNGIKSGTSKLTDFVSQATSKIDSSLGNSATKTSNWLEKLSSKLTSGTDVGNDYINMWKNGQSIFSDTSGTTAAATATDDLTGSTYDLSEAMDQASESTKKAGSSAKDATSDFENLQESVLSGIKSSMNYFEKFEKKEATSKEDILSNMKSQVEGLVSWTQDIVSLGQRGLSQSLLIELAEMGSDSYDLVQGFMQMTQEEIQQANLYFAQEELFPSSSMNSIMNDWILAGKNFGEGYANGLNPTAANQMAELLAINSLNTLQYTLDEHSPSKKTYQMGVNFVQGMSNGIKATYTAVNNAIIMGKNVLEGFKEYANFSQGKLVGQNIAQGVASGISSSKQLAIDAAKDLASSLPYWVRKVLDINSPSRVFTGIGKFIDMGLANGIDDGTNAVKSSLNDLANATIKGYNAGISEIAGMDLNPVITPTLDLTNIQAGASQINSILGGKSISATVDAINQNGVNNSSMIQSLKEEIVALGDKISNMQMVLDSGTLVGEITPSIDNQLGRRAVYAGRGN